MKQKRKGVYSILAITLVVAVVFNLSVFGLSQVVEAVSAQRGDSSHTVASAPKGVTPPSGVRVSGLKTTQVTVSWSKVKGAQMYMVLLNDKSIGEFTELGTTTKTSIDVTGLFPGTQYYVKVVSIKDGISSKPSGYVCFRTLRY